MKVFVLEMQSKESEEWQVIGVFKDIDKCNEKRSSLLKEGTYDYYLITKHEIE